MNLLITGGSGYVGSATVHRLKKSGHNITVFDNMVYGHKQALPKDVKFIKGDLLDLEALKKVFKSSKFDAVLHFAAYTYVGESVKNPEKYHTNNVGGSLNLLNCMQEFGVKKIIFSSSAGVYGKVDKMPITEDAQLNPESPYGETKMLVEKHLKDYDKKYGIKSVSLRYFNAAGADLENDLGEDHDPETHLIHLVIKVALGQMSEIKIFGNDYNTPDNTCVRDYIHIVDLASAHELALNWLNEGKASNIYNLGTGSGTSVREIIYTVKKVTGKDFKVVETERRLGDPDILVASFDKAKNDLGWTPKNSNIQSIIEDAWKWHSSHPNGY